MSRSRTPVLISVLMLLAVVVAASGIGAPSVTRTSITSASALTLADTPVAETSSPSPATAEPATPIPPTATATAIPPTASPTSTPKPKKTPPPTPTARPEAPTPENMDMSQVFDTGSADKPEIALTFDAGDDRGYAEQILDILQEYGVQASFGVTGEWATANPDLIKRMADEGHQIFDHTWSHQSFTGYSTSEADAITDPADRAQELDKTKAAIKKITGGYDTGPYWRPPYGDYDDSVLKDVAADGYTVTIRWSCDTMGWNGASVDEILQNCAVDQQNGAIIMMHVGDGSLDYKALPELIEDLEADGFSFVTLEQLLGS